jgi:hypothetical protein
MEYEVIESRDCPGYWRVEGIDREGCTYIAEFLGHDAERRARGYAAFLNAHAL